VAASSLDWSLARRTGPVVLVDLDVFVCSVRRTARAPTTTIRTGPDQPRRASRQG
jgi:hypothetical protein